MSRVIRFFALGYHEVMSIPIRAFWALVGNIHKVEADEDRRALRLAICAQSGESAKALFDEFNLKLQGTVVMQPDNPMEAVRDEDGISELKNLARRLA